MKTKFKVGDIVTNVNNKFLTRFNDQLLELEDEVQNKSLRFRIAKVDSDGDVFVKLIEAIGETLSEHMLGCPIKYESGQLNRFCLKSESFKIYENPEKLLKAFF